MDKSNIKDKLLPLTRSDILQELIYSAIGCGLFTLLFFFFPDESWDYPYLLAISGILTLTFFILFLILNQVNPRNDFFKVNYKRNVILFSIFNYASICFLYFNTNFSTNGIIGDNFYRTAYVTKMANSGYPQDFVYKDLSAFTGPFYWYCLALFSILFNIKPYRMLKLGMLFMTYVMPIALFEVWKKIYSKKIAFIISTLSIIFLNNAYTPDLLIVAFFIIPFIMYYFENCTNKRFSLRNYIISGIYGSIIFCTYFLYFLIIPIYFLIVLFQNRKKFMENLRHVSYITIFILIFSSWFWIPLLRDILLYGFESHQNRYFNELVLRLPLKYIIQIALIGAILFFGFVYIVKEYKNSENMKILGNLLLSIIVIYIIGLIGVLLHNPIMHVRFLTIMYYILIIASSVFYVRVANFFKENVSFRKLDINFNLSQVWIYILVIIIFINGYSTLKSTSESVAYEQANRQNVNYHYIDVVDELDYENKVFLTSYRSVALYRPIYLFLLPNPYFSHPSALYNERVKFLVKLSERDTSKEFYEEIVDSKFEKIDFFWLDIENSTDPFSDFIFGVAVEKFPEGRDYYDIVFKWELFSNTKYFKRHEIEGDIIYETK